MSHGTMTHWSKRMILIVATVVIAVAVASPLQAVPKFCGCWCKLVFPGTACTDVERIPYVVTNCGDWLFENFGQCAEPGPFFAPESGDADAVDVLAACAAEVPAEPAIVPTAPEPQTKER